MTGKSNHENNKPDFIDVIPEYSDNEILNILKKRKLYQDAAAKLAVQEALKRGLINSEQDLFAEEFRISPLHFSIFPLVENEKTRNKISKSIARSLIISGLIPTLWGVLKIYESEIMEGLVIFLLGFLWIFLSFLLIRKVNLKMINAQLLIFVAGVVYLLKTILELNSTTFMDFFILAIILLFVLYGLLYIRKLK